MIWNPLSRRKMTPDGNKYTNERTPPQMVIRLENTKTAFLLFKSH